MSMTHKDAILSILFYLGGDKKAIDLETLTVCCFKAFPSKFSMNRFPEYPRFDKIEKRMNEIEGNGFVNKDKTFHYKLTERGIQWIKDNPHIIELINKQEEKQGLRFNEMLYYKIGNQEHEVEVKKLKRSEAYKKYLIGEKDKISIVDFMAFLKVDVYANKELFDRKATRIKSICLRDKELRDIFNYLESKYGLNYGNFSKEIKRMSAGQNKKEVKHEYAR